MDATVMGNHSVPSDVHFAEKVILAARNDIIIGHVILAHDDIHSFVNCSEGIFQQLLVINIDDSLNVLSIYILGLIESDFNSNGQMSTGWNFWVRSTLSLLN